MRDQNVNIAFFQEAYCTSDTNRIWKSQWGRGQSFFEMEKSIVEDIPSTLATTYSQR